jgi:VRR-NUC domain
MTPDPTTIQCPSAIRDLWPDPLACQWLEQYPHLFDEVDLKLAQNQPSYHFCEWFAAIHLFKRDGVHSLVEKYVYQNHPAKAARLAAVLSEQERAILDDIERTYLAQPPDLFVFAPGTHRYWFVEVKGPGDKLSPTQLASHEAITRRLGVPVEVIKVVISGD